MGNWRTVRIIGTCDAEEVQALRQVVQDRPYTFRDDDESSVYDEWSFHCLKGGLGLMGLPVWPAEKFDAVGNLAERNYDVEDVAKTLEYLATIAPSLKAVVHCGGDYEETTVVASVVLTAGKAEIMPPMIEDTGSVSEEQVMLNFFQQLKRG